MTVAEIEQAKNTASWLNSISVAVASAGAIGPVFTFVFGAAPSINGWVLTAVSLVCFVLAWVLHMIGHDILGEIQ
jgi:hypothetical protein